MPPGQADHFSGHRLQSAVIPRNGEEVGHAEQDHEQIGIKAADDSAVINAAQFAQNHRHSDSEQADIALQHKTDCDAGYQKQ